MRYFGTPWPSGICDEGTRVAAPIGVACLECEEAVADGDQGTFINAAAVGGLAEHPVHRECSLLRVIGHHHGVCRCTRYADMPTLRLAALELWRRVQAA